MLTLFARLLRDILLLLACALAGVLALPFVLLWGCWIIVLAHLAGDE